MHDVILYYVKSAEAAWSDIRLDYDQAYLDKYYKYDDGDGRLHWRADLCAAGTRNGESGKPWRGIDPTAKGMHWKYQIAKLDELDAEGRIYWPKKTGGMPQYKRYRDELKGLAVSDLWTDIDRINPVGNERIGYPTQKPIALLDRILEASTEEGDVILDPFCGCGTAIEAAHRLNRKWIGIDVTYLAVVVIEARLKKNFGENVTGQYSVYGRPEDAEGARALAGRDWLEFQKWAVFKLGGLPKEKPGPDGGIDGIIRYHRVGLEQPNRAIVSVKGGLNVGVDAVHKLKSVMDREKAELGVLVLINPPTRAMKAEAASLDPVGPASRKVQRIQFVTVEQIFDRTPVDVPGMIDYPEVLRGATLQSVRKRVKKSRVEGQTELLLPIKGDKDDVVDAAKSRSIRVVDIEVTRASKRSMK